MNVVGPDLHSSSLQRDSTYSPSQGRPESLHHRRFARFNDQRSRSPSLLSLRLQTKCRDDDFSSVSSPQMREDRHLSLPGRTRELPFRSSHDSSTTLGCIQRPRSLPESTLLQHFRFRDRRTDLAGDLKRSSLHKSSSICDGSSERGSQAETAYEDSTPGERLLSRHANDKADPSNAGISLRDRLALQAQQSGLFNVKKPWIDRDGSPGSPHSQSPRSPDNSLGFHFRIPSFSASRAAPFLFSPRVSPRTIVPGGQQRGFFDSVPIDKGSSPGFSPLTIYEALQSSPSLPPQARQQDLFRVSVLGEEPETNEQFVDRLPDHLPNSPLCPKHPKNKSGGRGRCPVHGRNRTSEDTLSEEEEPIIRHKKDLKFFL